MVKLEDLSDIIRKKADIAIDEKNKGKVTFTKEEMLIIIAKFNMLENETERTTDIVSLIEKVTTSTINKLKGAHDKTEEGNG